MSTLVCFHAHPDDECIQTGGVMAKASDQGHRVVLVVATRGEVGEVPEGFLDPGETLADRRVLETQAAADVLGVHRIAWLGYRDSGMMGEPTNDDPRCFWAADVDEAAGRLAAILTEEDADVLTAYDPTGGYGHPDHIQVHRVGLRAAELAGTRRVYQTATNRDHIRRASELMTEVPEGLDLPDINDDFGQSEKIITARVDVSAYVDRKRRAMQAHPSQIGEQSFFLMMPPPMFEYAFGTEWFIRGGQGPGITEVDLLEGLD
jgi:LmbE family N-acetylglucosaminyl deacetylase